MTHHVSWSIKPALSATGMNSVGEIGPNWSWLQRKSASQLTTAPVSSCTTGWYQTSRSACSIAWRSSVASRSRRRVERSSARS